MSFWTQLRRSKPLKHDKTVNSNHTMKLPFEIWEIIINYALDEVRHPYIYCQPDQFPEFCIRLLNAAQFTHPSHQRDWRNIRLVCRTWRYLAGGQPYLRITRPPPKYNQVNMSKDVSVVVIGDYVDGSPLIHFFLRSDSHRLTAICLGQGNTTSLSLLLENPLLFQSLRSLTIERTWDTDLFWTAIQDGFPQLVTLTIRSHMGGGKGHYVLKNLEILNSGSWFRYQLSCPSLKHLSLRYMNSMNVDMFLLKHRKQLESVLFEPYEIPIFFRMDEPFLDLFPNLQLLGMEAELEIGPPPKGHPLRHLQVFPPGRWLKVDGLLRHLDQFPCVIYLYIRVDDIEAVDLETLEARCLERNVKVVRVPGARTILKSQPFSLSTILTTTISMYRSSTGFLSSKSR